MFGCNWNLSWKRYMCMGVNKLGTAPFTLRLVTITVDTRQIFMYSNIQPDSDSRSLANRANIIPAKLNTSSLKSAMETCQFVKQALNKNLVSLSRFRFLTIFPSLRRFYVLLLHWQWVLPYRYAHNKLLFPRFFVCVNYLSFCFDACDSAIYVYYTHNFFSCVKLI